MALTEVLDTLRKINYSDLDYEIRKLEGIREWAMAQLGIDYAVGDRVRIKDGYEVERYLSNGDQNGWWIYRECLVGGALATVREIDYNLPHRYWYATIQLDREWSVHDDTRTPTVRYWNGPVDETPEGYKPPSDYDIKHHPEGRRGTFSFLATKLEKVTADDPALCGSCPLVSA